MFKMTSRGTTHETEFILFLPTWLVIPCTPSLVEVVVAALDHDPWCLRLVIEQSVYSITRVLQHICS